MSEDMSNRSLTILAVVQACCMINNRLDGGKLIMRMRV